MVLNNVGYDHCHDSDFFIDRPNGSGDYLLLILKTDAVFTLDGRDIRVPKKSFFLYPPGMPQYYRCIPQQTFSNDWMHFLLSKSEETHLRELGIPLAKPVSLPYTEFFSFCIKAIADENSAGHLHQADSIQHYFWLMCNKVSEVLQNHGSAAGSTGYELLLTVRNQMYANPFWEWSVEWGSHQTRMSRSAFQHNYKEQFGVSFIQDLITARISYAKMLLRSTTLSVQEVGMQCGYKNYEHFARQFKKFCGVAPGQFRKEENEGRERGT